MLASLNHYHAATKNDHVYITGGPPTGYLTLPLVGYVETGGTDEQRIWRMKRGTRPFTVTVTDQQKAAFAALGYTSSTVVGYRIPDGSPNTMPTFQLQSPAGDFVLTGDYVERNDKVAAGWTQVGEFGGVTYRRLLPYKPANNTPPYASDGVLDADAEAIDPFAVFRAVEAMNPAEPDRGIQVVTAPRRQGSFAFRHNLMGGEIINGLKGDRSTVKMSAAQMIGDTPAAPRVLVQPTMEGLEREFRFSFLLTDNFAIGPETNTGAMIWEFHNGPQEREAGFAPCQVPMMMFVKNYPEGPESGPAVWFRVSGGAPVSGAGTGVGTGCTNYANNARLTVGTVEELRNHWVNIRAEIRFANLVETGGFINLYRDDQPIWSNNGPNMYREQLVTAFFGNYRQIRSTIQAEIIHDGWQMRPLTPEGASWAGTSYHP